MVVYHPGASRLADAMRDRRAELDIAQLDVPQLGGPSITHVKEFELGHIPVGVRDRTLSRIDVALRGTDGKWPAGTARKTLEGQKVQESEEQGISPNSLRDYVSAVARMQSAIAREIRDLPPDVLAAMSEVTAKQLDLVTNLNERQPPS